MKLSDAILTLSLKKENFYLSAFPDFLVFGIVKGNSYESFLLFYSFQLNILYSTLRNIVNFLTNDDIKEQTKVKIIFQKNQLNNYFWSGSSQNNSKIFKIYIENEIEFTLDLDFIENLILGLKHTYLSVFRLTSLQKIVLFSLSKLDQNKILEIKNDENIFINYINKLKYLATEEIKFEIFQLLNYYFDDIVILSQINQLS